MKYIIMVGLPGAGKGTQSGFLAEKHGFKHLSTGEILRKEIEMGTKLGKIAEKFIHKGDFLPDDLTMEMTLNAIDAFKETKNGFILDGFPRTIQQAVDFENYLKENGHCIEKVICLDIPANIALKRLIKRGAKSERADDNETIAHKRIEIYYQNTFPLVEFYDQNDLLAHVNGEDSIENVAEFIEEILKECV